MSRLRIVGTTFVLAFTVQLTSAAPNPKEAGKIAIKDPGHYEYSMPAYSVSTIRLSARP